MAFIVFKVPRCKWARYTQQNLVDLSITDKTPFSSDISEPSHKPFKFEDCISRIIRGHAFQSFDNSSIQSGCKVFPASYMANSLSPSPGHEPTTLFQFWLALLKYERYAQCRRWFAHVTGDLIVFPLDCGPRGSGFDSWLVTKIVNSSDESPKCERVSTRVSTSWQAQWGAYERKEVLKYDQYAQCNQWLAHVTSCPVVFPTATST